MALIKCYECGKQISDAAPSCPTCGAPKKAAPKKYHYITGDDGKKINTHMTKKEWEESIQRGAQRQLDMQYPKCPLCGGILEKITGIEGLFRGGIVGVAKKHRCTQCGHLV